MIGNLDLLKLGVGGSHLPPNLMELQNDSTSKEGIYYSIYMYKKISLPHVLLPGVIQLEDCKLQGINLKTDAITNQYHAHTVKT